MNFLVQLTIVCNVIMIRPSLSFAMPLLVVFVVTLFTNASAQTHLGEHNAECCFDDWKKTVGNLLELYTTNNKLDGPFKDAYDLFIAADSNFTTMNKDEDEFVGYCFGLINYKCVASTSKEFEPGRCNCNEVGPFNSFKTKNGGHCVMRENSICSANDGKSPEVPELQCGAGMNCVVQGGVFPTCKVDPNRKDEVGTDEDNSVGAGGYIRSPKVGFFLASSFLTLTVTLNVV